LVFQCKSLLFARFLVRFCDHAVCNPGADGENIVTTSCGADRRPSRFTSTRRWSRGFSVRDRLRHWVTHPLPLAPGSIFVGLPSLQTFEPRLASPDVSFYFLFTKATHRPQRLAPRLELSRLTLARPSRPPGGVTSTSQGHPRTIFRRALEHDNLVLAEVTAERSAG
jgi:hypothetical protein